MREPIYRFVDGAPIQVGTRVVVGTSQDETFDHTLTGLCGMVMYLEYECGCGQTYPNDPMIGVRLDNGHGEEFWTEELILQTK
jgi:hypothetical protein